MFITNDTLKTVLSGLKVYVDSGLNRLRIKAADSNNIGGILAERKTEGYNEEIKIGVDKKLYARSHLDIHSDWNQNDPTAPDYIKNRICYHRLAVLKVEAKSVNRVEFLSGSNAWEIFFNVLYKKLREEGTFTTTLYCNGIVAKSEVKSNYGNVLFSKEISSAYTATGLINQFPDGRICYFEFFSTEGKEIVFTPGEVYDLSIEDVSSNILLPLELSPNKGRSGKGLDSELFNAAESADGENAHAEGLKTRSSGRVSHAEGINTTASGTASHTEGGDTTASGWFSHAEGTGTTASGTNQHVQGEYNIDDPSGNYAHIVGNGNRRASSNAHTLDWNGNSWYQGSVLVAGIDMDTPDAELRPDSVIIKSSTPSSAKRFKITVTDDGIINATDIQTNKSVSVLLNTPENIQMLVNKVIEALPKT